MRRRDRARLERLALLLSGAVCLLALALLALAVWMNTV